VFIPDLNLAFEFQGRHHFDDMASSSFSPVEVYQQKDKEKVALCESSGITLVPVPYWWDQTLPSLRETVKMYCKDKATILQELH
jgi:hypothetical protein